MGRIADSPSTNDSLLLRLKDTHDELAWREFLDLYTPMVCRYAQRRGLQDADARDVAQEVFALVSRAIGAFEYDPLRGRFRAWLGLLAGQVITRQLKTLHRPGRGV